MNTRPLLSTFLLLALAACAAPSDEDSPATATGTTQASLYAENGIRLFTQNANLVPLCWHTPGYAREKGIIQRAIQRTWASVAPINFQWREGCPTTGGEHWVKVQIGRHTQVQDAAGNWFWDHSTDGQARGYGMNSLSAPRFQPADVFSGPGVTFWVEDGGTSEEHRMEYVAVHELGHVLGFRHEQDRTEIEARACSPQTAPGTPTGPYDPDSIMNYCNAFGNARGNLSEGDVAGVRDLYGYAPSRPNAVADINGDGRAEPIAVNLDGTYALPSTGSSFAQPGRWSDPFYGSRETAYADVNGDGKADAVAINFRGVYVTTSNGSQFVNWGAWVSTPFYGNRRTLVGDVNGDGMADLVAIDTRGTWVMTSTGSSFTLSGQWGEAFYGTVGTYLADVNGDGKRDIVANRGAAGVFVRLSDGTRFLPETKWSDGFFGARTTDFADIDGDGKADGIAVSDEGIYVRLSDGTRFNWAGIWSPYPFYGSRDTVIGDVNGDGRADAVAVNNSGEWVMLSTGSGFGPSVQWSGPFYTQ